MKYAKFVVAALAAGAVALQAAITDGTVTSAEWVTIGLAVLGALGVVLVPNKDTDEAVQHLRGQVR